MTSITTNEEKGLSDKVCKLDLSSYIDWDQNVRVSTL